MSWLSQKLRERRWARAKQTPPFRLIDECEMPNVALNHIGMLESDDRRIYYQAARDLYSFNGSMVDAGVFVGGTTMSLVCGLIANPRLTSTGVIPPVVHAYDLFEYNFATRESLDYITGEDRLYEGESYFAHFKRLMGPFMAFVHPHIGDIRAAAYCEAQPIEVLGVDICKTRELTNAVFGTFFPKLMPGAYVLHQDLIHTWHPQIHVAMGYFSEHFDVIHECDVGSTVLYRLTKPISAEQLPAFADALMLGKADWISLFDRCVSQLRKPRTLRLLQTTRTLCIAEAEGAAAANAYARTIRNSLTDVECRFLDQALGYIAQGMPPHAQGPRRHQMITGH